MKWLFLIFLSCSVLSLAQKPEIIAPAGHKVLITDFDISPDNKRVISVSIDQSFVVWDIRTRFPIKQINGHTQTIHAIRYAPDGNTFVTASSDSTLKIWDAASFKLVRTIKTRGECLTVSYSNLGDYIATGTSNGYLQIFKTKDGNLHREQKARESAINTCTFFNINDLIMVGTEDGHYMLFLRDEDLIGTDLDMKIPIKKIVVDRFASAFAIHGTNGKAEILLLPSFEAWNAIAIPTKTYPELNNTTFVGEMGLGPEGIYFAYADIKGRIFISRAEDVTTRGYEPPHSGLISKILFSKDGRWLVSSGHGNRICIADLKGYDHDKSEQIPYKVLRHDQNVDRVAKIKFTHDNRLIAQGESIYQWDLTSADQEHFGMNMVALRQQKDRFDQHTFGDELVYSNPELELLFFERADRTEDVWSIRMTCFNQDQTQALYRKDESIIRINFKDNSFTKITSNDLKETIGDISFIPNQTNFLIYYKNKVTCFDADGKKLWSYQSKEEISKCKPSPQGDVIALVTKKADALYFLSSEDGKVKQTSKGDDMSDVFCWHPNNVDLAIFSFADKKIKRFNYKTTITKTITDWNDYAINLAFSKGGDLFAAQKLNGQIALFEMSNKIQKLYDLYYLNNSGSVVVNNDGYYMSTPDSYKNLAFNYNNEIYPCEQFDAFLNRPDKVLKSSPFADQELISLYANVVEKRKGKLGINDLNSAKALPEISIRNKHELSNISFESSVKVDLVITKETSISTINVWLNDVPIYGQNGKKAQINQGIISEQIHLIPGKNKIQISVKNLTGEESLRETINITREVKDQPNLYIVSVGVSEYQDSAYNLNYAQKDAQDIIAALKNSKAFQKQKHLILTNDEVKKSELSKIHDFLLEAGEDDIVMMFVAGHGVLDADYNYYFGTHDMDFDKPHVNGILYEELEAVLDNLPSIRKILFMDTCHSGELDAEEVEIAANVEEVDGLTFRTAGTAVTKSNSANANSSQLVREMFADLRKFSGTTVISSASGGEYAIESKEWQNGLFTYCLLHGLVDAKADLNNDGEIWLSEIQDYVYSQVTKLSNGRQSPTTRWQNLSMDYRIW